MLFLNRLLFCIFIIIIVLIRVAFVTLLEQKILAYTQIRVGPNFTGYWGLLQPFADAIKLLNKETVNLRSINEIIYYICPIISLILSLFIWIILPILHINLNYIFRILFFILIRRLSIYPILFRGWRSNCVYSILGSLRAVAQIISYEIRLIIILLAFIIISKKLLLREIILNSNISWGIWVFLPLFYIWFASTLAETNRTPYDFSEGESELVSGFNTEYRAGGFTLIFIAEYSSILFIRFLTVVLFFSSNFLNFFIIFKAIIISALFIWVRASLPRYRYDKLMNLAWKRFLPVRIFLLIFYLFINYLNSKSNLYNKIPNLDFDKNFCSFWVILYIYFIKFTCNFTYYNNNL